MSAPRKPKAKRIRVLMPLALKEAVGGAAKKLNISRSRFLVLAIREELSLVEAAIASQAEVRQPKRRRSLARSLFAPSRADIEVAMPASRIVRVCLSQLQGCHMRTNHQQGSIKLFARIATDLQLIRLKDATPISFEVGEGAAEDTLVAVRNLKRDETSDWERAKVGYTIIALELKKRGLASGDGK